MGSFFKIDRVSYFYFHSSLGFEAEDITMEGFCRREVRDGQCQDLEGCSVLSDRVSLYKVGKLIPSCSGGINGLELPCKSGREGGPGKRCMDSKISPPEKGISLKEGHSEGDCMVWVLVVESDILVHLEQPGVWCLARGFT